MKEPAREIEDRFKSGNLQVAVFGLGYVGLPLAVLLADSGCRVVGIDVDPDRVDAVNAGENPLDSDEPGLAAALDRVYRSGRLVASADPRDAAQSSIFTINVQTPVDANHQPDLEPLTAASQSIGSVMMRGSLVVVESTVSPGTTQAVVQPALERASGFVEGADFWIGACPERVMPGRLLANLTSVARVCGGSTPAVAQAMSVFYTLTLGVETGMTDITTAELVKTTENAYRDVQIAFANEIALLCADLDIDVWEVREFVNKVPHRNMHRPGGGVGGHCIPKDPWLLAAAAPKPLHLIPAARHVNDSMPLAVAGLVKDAARTVEAKTGVTPKVAILGYSYLPETGDTRNSPTIDLLRALGPLGETAVVYDPHVEGLDGSPHAIVDHADIVVKMVDHRAFRSIRVPPGAVFIDAQHLADARRVVGSTLRNTR